MAGVDPNAGTDAIKSTVPSIGGSAEVAGMVAESPRGEGVSYPETPGVGPFPAGTDVGEANNPLK